MKHKHADAIIAWANGAAIQYRTHSRDTWRDTEPPHFDIEFEYRIKPTPAKTYPKSTLSYDDLCRIWKQAPEQRGLENIENKALRLCADEAVVCFIESGEMVKYFTNPENGHITVDNN